jgi:hypothetical protein
MRTFILLLVMLVATAPGLAQQEREERVAKNPGIETTYDSDKDKTTVRMMPVQIAGDKKQAAIRMDSVNFELSSDHLRALRTFAETLSNKG